MAKRYLIFDLGPAEPCGCRWQVWREGDDLHVGTACKKCQKEITELLLSTWPDLDVREIE